MRNFSVFLIIILFGRKAEHYFAVSIIPKKEGNILSLSLGLGREESIAQIGTGCIVTGFTDESTYRTVVCHERHGNRNAK